MAYWELKLRIQARFGVVIQRQYRAGLTKLIVVCTKTYVRFESEFLPDAAIPDELDRLARTVAANR